ncbi:MAG: hypothetical protein ACQETB_13135 [Halobacteriota archaeon]
MGIVSIIEGCFRTYAAAAVGASALTVLVVLGVVDLSPTALAAIWIAIAALGGVTAIGMTTNKGETCADNITDGQKRRFTRCWVTGWPLNVYLIAVMIWSGVSFGWVLGGASVTTFRVVGYGWLAVTTYGVILLIGLLVAHSEDVATVVDLTERKA